MAENSIGALWINEGEKGKFLAGKVTIDGITTSILVFKNDYKKSDSHPDYRIFLSNKPAGEIPPQPENDLEPF